MGEMFTNIIRNEKNGKHKFCAVKNKLDIEEDLFYLIEEELSDTKCLMGKTIGEAQNYFFVIVVISKFIIMIVMDYLIFLKVIGFVFYDEECI